MDDEYEFIQTISQVNKLDVLDDTTAVDTTATTDIDRHIENQRKRYAKLTVNQLKALLLLNDQIISGTKEQLIERVATCTVLGSLPPCLTCGGRLRWNPVLRVYQCVARFGATTCDFQTVYVERLPWRSGSQD